MFLKLVINFFLVFSIFNLKICIAENPQELEENIELYEDNLELLQLGEEYKEYSKSKQPTSSSKRSTLRTVMMYVPNRIVDLFDVFRVDLGVGPAVGGVIRMTKYAQVGARTMLPASVRIGARGRAFPGFIESRADLGISPAFTQSRGRRVGSTELGAGVDIFLLGAYVGLDLSELADFFCGIVGIDFKRDDF